MSKKKENVAGYLIAFVALIGCCLFLPILLAGGAATFFGVYLKNNWLIISGIVIIGLLIFLRISTKGNK